jgi:hypothetical protein
MSSKNSASKATGQGGIQYESTMDDGPVEVCDLHHREGVGRVKG